MIARNFGRNWRVGVYVQDTNRYATQKAYALTPHVNLTRSSVCELTTTNLSLTWLKWRLGVVLNHFGERDGCDGYTDDLI